MQLASRPAFPEPPLAAMWQLSENSRLGFRLVGNTLHQGFGAGKYLIGIGDTASVVQYAWLESLKAQQQMGQDPTLPTAEAPPLVSNQDKADMKTAAEFAVMVGIPDLGEVAAAGIRMAEVASAGRSGEEAAQAVESLGTKEYFKAGGRARFTDGSTSTTVNEVKNVAKQGWTQQLKDEAGHAAATSRTFQLWVRSSTQVSGPLQAA